MNIFINAIENWGWEGGGVKLPSPTSFSHLALRSIGIRSHNFSSFSFDPLLHVTAVKFQDHT